MNPFTEIHKKLRDPDSFLQSAVNHKRQHYTARCSAAGKLFAVCAFEVSEGIYLSEMKSILKRIHRGISERSAISYAAAESREIICGLCFRSVRRHLSSRNEARSFLSGFIVVFLKDRIFLTRLHKTGSVSAFRSRSKGPMLIPYHSNRLLPVVVAHPASFF